MSKLSIKMRMFYEIGNSTIQYW